MAALSLALAPSLAAADTPGFSDLAVFTGNAPIGATSTPCPGAVCWVGGTGPYNFASTICAYASDVEVPADAGAVAELTGGLATNGCTVNPAGGNFDNVVCGTGFADGTATITANLGGDLGETTTVAYSIVFAGTVGIITGTANESDSGQSWIAGAVQIRAIVTPPTPGAPGQGACTTTFTPTVAAAIFDGAPPPVPTVLGCTDADGVVTSGLGGWPLDDPFGCLPVVP